MGPYLDPTITKVGPYVPGIHTWYQVPGTRYHTLYQQSIQLLQQFLHANKKKEQEASERSSISYLKNIFVEQATKKY